VASVKTAGWANEQWIANDEALSQARYARKICGGARYRRGSGPRGRRVASASAVFWGRLIPAEGAGHERQGWWLGSLRTRERHGE